MITFSVKVEDELHQRLQRQLETLGKTRSGFVRELIERELASTGSNQAAGPDHPISRFRGVIKGQRNSRDDALRVDEILAGEGYGADGAHP